MKGSVNAAKLSQLNLLLLQAGLTRGPPLSAVAASYQVSRLGSARLQPFSQLLGGLLPRVARVLWKNLDRREAQRAHANAEFRRGCALQRCGGRYERPAQGRSRGTWFSREFPPRARPAKTTNAALAAAICTRSVTG